MTQAVQGSLTMVGLNTPAPKVFWNGLLVAGILSIRVDNDEDEQRIKLKVCGSDDAVYASMLASGINIKVVV